MSDGIVYEYATMDDVAASIGKCVGVFEDIQKQMDSIVASLKEAIVGDAENAFEEGHASVKGKYEEIQQTTQSFAEKLQEAAQKMADGDHAAAQKVLSFF